MRNQPLPRCTLPSRERFGEVAEYPRAGLEGHPLIIPIMKLHERHNFGGIWHFRHRLSRRSRRLGTMLVARELPPYGGDTLYSEHGGRLRGAVADHAAHARRPVGRERLGQGRRDQDPRGPHQRMRRPTSRAARSPPSTRWCAPIRNRQEGALCQFWPHRALRRHDRGEESQPLPTSCSRMVKRVHLPPVVERRRHRVLGQPALRAAQPGQRDYHVHASAARVTLQRGPAALGSEAAPGRV